MDWEDHGPDLWTEGYAEGLREATMTVRDLVKADPQVPVCDILADLESTRATIRTYGVRCQCMWVM